MKTKRIRNIIVTIVLILIMFLLFYIFIGINISGPYYKHLEDENAIVEKIEDSEDDVISITRNSFAYVTYTCETDRNYVIYDVEGERVLSRSKREVDLEEAKEIIEDEYRAFADCDITIAYGYEGAVYLAQIDAKNMVMLDIDTFEEVYFMREG